MEVGHLDGVLARGAGKGAGASCAEGQVPGIVTPRNPEKESFPFSPLPPQLVLLKCSCVGEGIG